MPVEFEEESFNNTMARSTQLLQRPSMSQRAMSSLGLQKGSPYTYVAFSLVILAVAFGIYYFGRTTVGNNKVPITQFKNVDQTKFIIKK